MRCSKCGVELPSGAEVCYNCGTPTPNAKKTNLLKPEPSKDIVTPSIDKKDNNLFSKQNMLIVSLFVIIIMLIVIIWLLFNVATEEKSMVCTYTEGIAMYTISQTFDINSKGNEIQSAAVTTVYALNDDFLNEADELYEDLKEAYEDYDENGTAINVEKSTDTVTVTMEFTTSGLEEFMDIDLSSNGLDTLISEVEEQGYTCSASTE